MDPKSLRKALRLWGPLDLKIYTGSATVGGTGSHWKSLSLRLFPSRLQLCWHAGMFTLSWPNVAKSSSWRVVTRVAIMRHVTIPARALLACLFRMKTLFALTTST